MSKAKFILKEPKSKVETLVYLIYNYQYRRFKYSTGEKINPKFWNKKSQRAKETKLFKEYPEFNTRLDIIQNGINNAFRKLLNDGIETNNANLKVALENELSDHIVKPKKKSLLSFIESFIEESKLNKKTGTIKVYKTTYKYLKEFNDKYKPVNFETITLEFYNRYLAFLSNDHGLSANTVGKHIKTIKSFMNEATERGVNNNLEFRNKKFKTIREESDSIYLSVDELNKIEKLDLSSSPRLEKVKDLFLIGCYTGLRFSDFTQIKQENINSDNTVINIRTHKTGQRVSIPLHKTVRNILKKYNNNLPKAYTNQTMNEYLKQIVSLAGIKELIETTITRAGKIEKNISPKYKLVSTHTARRSFATNLYLAEVPTISIMKITGHKTEKSFLQYIRVTQKENADKLLTHPFFN
ncbi:site-specific integrase [Psychroserpens sp.]|uniref:tyrosine-type recombinase/integrase n=1 Tax=Psychroserpens sp. TaxID=2020870 RepID=UPI001B035CC8|nr:site-specific integrase [Psychroserpens sp.]MBO6605311.1 site-specific integrase [Psychroserpens sp.]MBO6630006.1 site-specific integrase [Psychroserpens sp.]MBO6653880.1 site-specific integrase [Psychroserpens sp.]MBO6682201.1 site-specific integrase [Psychroserpens sp.]MBO6748685.1 site-specific integrase [Psychroserpens sp.]